MRDSTVHRVGLTAVLCLLVFLGAGPALGQPAELVSNINTSNADSKARPRIVIGDTLFFTADDGIHGIELWATDGTTAGTRMVADLWPGRASSWPSAFVELAGTLLFGADDGEHGYELWRSVSVTLLSAILGVLRARLRCPRSQASHLQGPTAFRYDDR